MDTIGVLDILRVLDRDNEEPKVRSVGRQAAKVIAFEIWSAEKERGSECLRKVM